MTNRDEQGDRKNSWPGREDGLELCGTGDVMRLLETRQDPGTPRNLLGACPSHSMRRCFSKCVRSWVLGRSCSPAKLRGAQLSSSCVWQ